MLPATRKDTWLGSVLKHREVEVRGSGFAAISKPLPYGKPPDAVTAPSYLEPIPELPDEEVLSQLGTMVAELSAAAARDAQRDAAPINAKPKAGVLAAGQRTAGQVFRGAAQLLGQMRPPVPSSEALRQLALQPAGSPAHNRSALHPLSQAAIDLHAASQRLDRTEHLNKRLETLTALAKIDEEGRTALTTNAAGDDRPDVSGAIALLRAEAPVLQARLSSLQAKQDEHQNALTQASETHIQRLLDSPLSPTAPMTESLRSALGGLAEKLNETTSASKVPTPLALETIKNTLLTAVHDMQDNSPSAADRAAAVLQKLVTDSSLLSAAPMADGEPDRDVQEQVIAFTDALLKLPRGMETLQRMAPAWMPAAGAIEVDASRASPNESGFDSALRVYISARHALHQTPDGPEHRDSRQWLTRALEVAQGDVRGEPLQASHLSPERRAAYHGVRNGFTAVGPGTLHQAALERLEKVQTWVARANNIEKGSIDKSPFKARAMLNAFRQAQQTGAQPSRSAAFGAAMTSARALTENAEAWMATNTNQQARAVLQGLVQAIDEKAQRKTNNTLTSRLGRATGHTRTEAEQARATNQQLKTLTVSPALIDRAIEIARTQTTVLDSRAQAVLSTLKETRTDVGTALNQVLALFELADSQAPDAGVSTDEQENPLRKAQAHADQARLTGLWKRSGDVGASELAHMLGTAAGTLDPRDKVRIAQGGRVGLGLSGLGVSTALSQVGLGLRPEANRTVGREAVIEMGRPSQGPTVLIGTRNTKQTRLGLAVGPQVGLGAQARLDATVVDAKWAWESEDTEGVIMRFSRDRENELLPQAKMEQAVRDLVRFGTDALPRSSDTPNVLDHLLANHPGLVLTQVDADHKSAKKTDMSIGVSVSGSVGSGETPKVSGGVAGASGSQVASRVASERPGVQNSQAVRIGAAQSTLMRMGVGLSSPGVAIGSETNLRANLQRGEVSIRTSVNAIERSYKMVTINNEAVKGQVQSNTEFSSFKEFRQTVEAKKDAWVKARAKEMPGGETLPQNLLAAQQDLTAWLDELQHNAREDMAYTVGTQLDDALLPQLDHFRAAMTTARNNQDNDAMQIAVASLLALQNSPSAFEEKRLIVKQSIKAPVSGLGLGLGVVAETTVVAETQRGISQWPPQKR